MRGQRTRSRRRVVVDNSALARAIGSRIRAARRAAQLTQQELAGDRYTKAYISALELGQAKPSMAALDYLASRLGTTADRLLTDSTERWSRLDADLCLASGRYDEAVAAYLDLADRRADPVIRGELLLGASEALCRLRRFREAVGPITEAIRLLEAGGRRRDVRVARYWLANVHAELDDPEEARRLLLDLLGEAATLPEEPDFEVRVRIALAIDETEHGSPDRARLYLEEAREQAGGLDARRRAIYLDVLAKSRFAAGDIEGAIRAGLEALALFHATRYELEEALLENELAMSYIALGSLDRADELVASALATAGRLGHHSAVGHITDTSATIRLARGDPAGALELAERSLAIEAEHGPSNEQLGARVTRAQALEALGRSEEAVAAWAEAGAIARNLASAARRRRILSAWAASLAAQGRHAEAYEVLRDTL